MMIYKVTQDFESANTYTTADALQLVYDLGDYLDTFDDEIPSHDEILNRILSLKPGEAARFKDITILCGDAVEDHSPKHKPFCVVYDCETGGFIDGIECATEGEAKDLMIDILSAWMGDQVSGWKFSADGIPSPTGDQIERWDDMVFYDSVYYVELDQETGEYKDNLSAVYPSDEDLAFIGYEPWADSVQRSRTWQGKKGETA